MRPTQDWDELETRLHESQARLTLRCTGGPLHGRVLGSDGATISIGRREGCAIQLAVAECSRVHARIQYRSGQFWIEDLRTRNGTRVNGELIERETALHEGDRIQIGEQELEVTQDLLDERELVRDALGDIGTAELPPVAPVLPQRPSRRVRTIAWRMPRLPQLPQLSIRKQVIVGLAIGLGLGLTVFSLMRRPSHAPVVVVATEPPPPVTTPLVTGPVARPGTIELTTPAILNATGDGVVRSVLSVGTQVDLGARVVEYRESTAGIQARLDEINAELESDENNKKLIAQARAEGARLYHPRSWSVKSPLRGVVVSAPEVGSRVQEGQELARVAGMVLVHVAQEATLGEGSRCLVRFVDQQDLAVAAEALAPTPGGTRTYALKQVPALLALGSPGRVLVQCSAAAVSAR